MSVYDSDSILNRGTEPIIRFRLCFFFKLGSALPVSITGMRMCSRLCFQFSGMGLDEGELGSICYNCGH